MIARSVRSLGMAPIIAILMCVICGVGGAEAAEPRPGAATTSFQDSLWTPAQRDTLQRLRDLIKGARYGEAETGAGAMLAEVEKGNGEETMQAAMVLDVLVDALRRGGKSRDPRSRELAERTVRLKERLLGREHPEVATSLSSLGLMFRAAGDLAGARPFLERALEIREKALGPDHPDVARSLNNLAVLLNDAGDNSGAEPLYRRALAIREKALGPDHPDVAASLNNLATLLLESRDHAGARPLLERALAIREKALGPDHPDVAQGCHNLASLLWGMGDYEGARPLYERALAIREKALGPDHPDLAEDLNDLAGLLYERGDFAGARPLFERALAIKEKVLGPYHPSVAVTLGNLANLLTAAGNYAEARPLYERALTIEEKALGPDHPSLAQSLGNLANLLGEMRDYAGARSLQERALKIQEKALGPDHPDVAASHNNLASLLDDMGDHAGARPHLERALAIQEKSLGPDHPDVAASLDNLGNLLLRTGDYAGARPLYERALAIQEKALGPDHPTVALSINNLAGLLLSMGDHAGARTRLERALAIREKALGPDHPLVAATLNNLALLIGETGDYAGARPLNNRALKIQEKALGPDHPELARTLDNLSILLWGMGETQAAANSALKAEAIAREHFRITARVLPERQALAFAVSRTSGLPVALSLLTAASEPQMKREVVDAQVRSRALVLDELAARHRSLRKSSDPEVERLIGDYRATNTRYASLLARGPDAAQPERYRPQLDQARQERERSERALSEKSAAFGREQAERSIGLSEVAAALTPESALLAFVSYQQLEAGPRGPGVSSYLAYVLHGGTDRIEVVRLGAARAVDSLVAQWKEEAGGGVQKHLRGHAELAYSRAGAALREKVWDPVMPHLQGIERVFVVPDGALNLVSLATLPLEDGSYLLEHGPLLHTLSAERDLVTLKALAEEGRGLLAMGGPAYDARPGVVAASSGKKDKRPVQLASVSASGAYRGTRSGCAELATREFTPLPGTLREVKEIGNLWRAKRRSSSIPGAGRVMELIGAEAGERAFKQEAPGHAVLHLATHGFFITGRCRSALDGNARGIGGVATEREPRPVAVADENPLVLSGLALAGANRRSEASPEEEDGILTAEEIAALDLGGVEWAVLSACETGVGDVRAGEGVFGLRRAFQVAGARTLIMSLWAVEDQAARAWMRELYRGRHERGLGTAEAVREASLTLLRERRAKGQSTHPFYWGAFVAAGDWR